MNEPRPTSGSLPPDLEDEVLAILDGDEHRREHALRALLQAHPQHVQTIRRWLTASGVPVPVTVGSAAGGGTDDADLQLPAALGPYVLLERLGRGGFGTVYRGEQHEPIHRAVAVKIMNPGLDSRDLLARFAAEREALNRMDHPGIARLLDAGTTTKGRPYFVMELVAGPTLLAHCRKQRLPVRARIQLFLLVLDAMQHAHQKAMLHRDLSSNNVLVADPDGSPQPKIIDFGIAKSLNDPLLHGGALTTRGTLMGTPEFMSPEQAAGNIDDVDTRADVYALGVQLYELLTDQLPIPGVALRSQGLVGMAEIVRTYQPALASEAAPKERRPELRGDLDAILAKSLAKAREERYGSVGEFAADLRRWLADEPVAVATPSTWYRLRRFVRRHRAQSIAAAIAGASLVAALLSLWGSLRMANAAAADAKAAQLRSDARADAGFLLLANDERLVAARAAEARLGPPWPEFAADYEQWMRHHGEPLRAQHAEVRQQLAVHAGELAATGDAGDMWRQHLVKALRDLDAQLATFLAPDGPFGQVQRRQRLLHDVIAPTAAAWRSTWDATRAAIETSDGVTASRAYRGLRVPELAGLVPLGADPRTGLHEFLDLASHRPGHPLPARAADGRLALDADTGLVLVLVPGGLFDQGASRNRPGVDRNDELANDDELGAGPLALDAFLIASTELTRAQWNRLAGVPVDSAEARLPATQLDWRTARDTLTRFGLQLPTEARWEYACRAGSRTRWTTGDSLGDVASAGWFLTGLHPVAQLAPNAFGLFDVHGNAAEWCEDVKLPYVDTDVRRGDGLRTLRLATPGDAPRVVRGGAWHQGPPASRSTARDAMPPTTRGDALGVRPARSLRRPD